MKPIRDTICAALVCVAVLTTLIPLSAAALSKGVYTASVVTTYYNPDTGEIDDGGTANAALGEGMCRSATGTKALIESDGKNTWVTVRLLLQSNCKNVALYTRNGYNSYSKASYTVMQENAGEDSIDYRFKVSDAGVMMKGTMYVTPMGRNVLWYLYIDTSTIASGSSDFVVSIDTSTPASSSSGKSSGSSSGSHSSTSAAVAGSSAGTSGSTASGKVSGSTDALDSEDSGEEDGDGTTDEGTEEEDSVPDDSDPESSSQTPDSKKSADDSDEGGLGGTAAVLVIAVIAVAGGGTAVLIRRRKR